MGCNTENKIGYITCGSFQVKCTSTWLFKENKGGYIPCESLLVKDFTRLLEISRTGGCLVTRDRHNLHTALHLTMLFDGSLRKISTRISSGKNTLPDIAFWIYN